MFKTDALDSVANRYIDDIAITGTPGTRLEADDRNITQDEIVNAIESSDQTLDASGTFTNNDQLAKAMSIYGAGGASFYTHSGAVNAYVLTISSPKETIPALFDGFRCRFKVFSPNTGASTVNVSGFGVKAITTDNGVALSGGEISGLTDLQYNLANDRFELVGALSEDIFFDDTGMGFTATEVQTAIEELDSLIGSVRGLYNAYVKVSDVKASGTDGGTFTSGSWQTRVINTLDSDSEGIASISSNKITLPAGTYDCMISCPAVEVTENKAQLYDTTGSAVLLLGTNQHADSSTHGSTNSIIMGEFTLAVDSDLEIQHRCSQTKTTTGFGRACGFSGVSDIYTVAEFRRRL